jgi:hypothetical protein
MELDLFAVPGASDLPAADQEAADGHVPSDLVAAVVPTALVFEVELEQTVHSVRHVATGAGIEGFCCTRDGRNCHHQKRDQEDQRVRHRFHDLIKSLSVIP